MVVACGALIALAAVGVVLARVARLRPPITERGSMLIVGAFLFGIGVVAVTVVLELAEDNRVLRVGSQVLVNAGLFVLVLTLLNPLFERIRRRRRQQLRKWGTPPLPDPDRPDPDRLDPDRSGPPS
jgi:hypothetical protein